MCYEKSVGQVSGLPRVGQWPAPPTAACLTAILAALLLAAPVYGSKKPPKKAEPTPLDRYISEAMSRPAASRTPSPGSLWSPTSRLTDLGRDIRAAQVDDMVTILVAEKASAVVSGTTKTSRQSSVNSSIAGAGGLTKKTGPLQNLANATTQTALNGDGTTSRDTAISTTLSARVSQVLPNGYLVVEGNKEVMVNSERQVVSVRGVVRPNDLNPGNVVSSDQVAQMEIKVNGKGVVGDSIRRPFILYRILLGLLPF